MSNVNWQNLDEKNFQTTLKNKGLVHFFLDIQNKIWSSEFKWSDKQMQKLLMALDRLASMMEKRAKQESIKKKYFQEKIWEK